MIRRLLDNIEIKVICAFLAIIVWLNANDRTDMLGKAREFISDADSGTVLLRDVPIDIIDSKDTSDFSVEPNRISISVICSKNAVIDMATLRARVKWQQKDGKKVVLDKINTKLPEGLKFIKSEPKEVRINKISSSG